MYTRYKLKSALLYLGGFIAVGSCVALIAFFAHILVLRTEYRAFAMEVNDQIVATPAEECFIRRGDTTLPMTAAQLDYFDQILLDRGTAVVSRKEQEGKSELLLLIGQARLHLIRLDNTLLCLRWETPEGQRGYTVRSDIISYAQMNAYFQNMERAYNEKN